MARRLPKADPVGRPRRAKSAAEKAADEAQVLDPTVRLTVGGEEITVREYGFFQKQRVLFQGRAFLADVEAMVNGGEVDDVFDDIKPLLGVHEAFVKYAIAESIGRPVSFVEALDDLELEPLVYLWFAQAGRFFFGEIRLRARGRALLASAGSTSSTNSAATSSGSADTPSGS